MILTSKQEDFFLQTFFKLPENINWEEIAAQLLRTGKCIVAGTTPIWRGGIGNFIKVEPAEGTVGCSLYTFDLETFMTSELFKGYQITFIGELEKEVRETAEVLEYMQVKLKEIKALK